MNNGTCLKQQYQYVQIPIEHAIFDFQVTIKHIIYIYNIFKSNPNSLEQWNFEGQNLVLNAKKTSIFSHIKTFEGQKKWLQETQ
jgi:hypothetical protein